MNEAFQHQITHEAQDCLKKQSDVVFTTTARETVFDRVWSNTSRGELIDAGSRVISGNLRVTDETTYRSHKEGMSSYSSVQRSCH